MAVLSLGHLCVDLCQGALPALLPFLIAAHHWSYGQASALVLAATICSSIVQPLFGHLSDGRSLPWLMPGGVALAAIGISLAGVAGSYRADVRGRRRQRPRRRRLPPRGVRFANYVAGEKRATAMSFFSVGGNAGLRARPGDRDAARARVRPRRHAARRGAPARRRRPARGRARAAHGLPPRRRRAGPTRTTSGAEPDQWRPFVRLTLAIAARSVVFFGLTTLVPLYFVGELAHLRGHGEHGAHRDARVRRDRHARRRAARRPLQPPDRAAHVARRPHAADGRDAPRRRRASRSARSPSSAPRRSRRSASRSSWARSTCPGGSGSRPASRSASSIGVGGVAAAGLGALADVTSLRTALEVVALLPLPALALALSLPEGRRPGASRTRAKPPASRPRLPPVSDCR